ncbi:hypothetical protein ACNHKD_14850 [Methylocystis sp. JAN1]|uniref:hypothetical protein n=1 Tax=Methylocystis sp. JAN1 TaxID=3397211 RepID=UPI003FA28288
MYGLAYVIIPTEFASLQGVLDEALAPFRRGGPDEFPREKLAFDDVTDALRRLHDARFEFRVEGGGVVISGHEPALTYDLDSAGIRAFLDEAGLTSWSGCLADVEPDLDAFAARFTKWKARDPEAGGYGEWLNPSGRWDWWELGGRFDGVISGHPRPGAGNDCMISSGANSGRDLLGGLARALGGKPSEIEAEIEANVELVFTLLEAARRGEDRAFPTAIALPVGTCADEFRWFDALGWRPIPPETKAFLSVPDDASFKETAVAVYERFHTMAAAGVAFHF